MGEAAYNEDRADLYGIKVIVTAGAGVQMSGVSRRRRRRRGRRRTGNGDWGWVVGGLMVRVALFAL